MTSERKKLFPSLSPDDQNLLEQRFPKRSPALHGNVAITQPMAFTELADQRIRDTEHRQQIGPGIEPEICAPGYPVPLAWLPTLYLSPRHRYDRDGSGGEESGKLGRANRADQHSPRRSERTGTVQRARAMVNFTSLILLATYAIGGLVGQQGPRPKNLGGCACPCNARPAKVVVWGPEDGKINEFIVRTIKSGYNRGEPLILLGRSPKGLWSLETSGDEYAMKVDLVCNTVEGKREPRSLIESYPQASYEEPTASAADLSSRALTGLKHLEKRGDWRPEELVAISKPLLSTYPRLVLHETGDFDRDDYSWTLRARAKAGRFVVVTSGNAHSPKGFRYYRDSRCVAGVSDGAGREIWWVFVATAMADDCEKEWRAIRLTREP